MKRGDKIEVTIQDLAFGGKGIARVGEEGYVVFVPNTIPGQTVKCRLIKKRKRHAEGKLLEVITHSDEETPLHFQPIPGAPYATWPIEKQRAHKQQSTFELFKRIGNEPEIEARFDEFIASPADWHYRNKMEYSFSTVRYDLKDNGEYDEPALGFKHRGQWLAVENMDADSGLFDKEIEDGVKHIRQWCEASQLPFWHPARHHGFYRFLTFRKSFSTGKVLMNLTTSGSHLEAFNAKDFVAHCIELFGDRLAGIIQTINNSTGDRTMDEPDDVFQLYGEPVIHDTLLGLDFEISMRSFFQPNPQAAQLLYQKAIDYVFLNRDKEEPEVVMDLFCGTGTIGQILAKQSSGAKEIIGVDIIPEAIENAKENAKRNGLNGLNFYAADVGKFLYNYPEYKGRINTIVLDPPRGGIAPKTLQKIIALGAKRIVYVSCNPATQARDTNDLREAGYALEKISMVDQFPHTSHIETVALFNHHG
jgi:23S rRNA (uracil-5-)-methyltransferase RumA